MIGGVARENQLYRWGMLATGARVVRSVSSWLDQIHTALSVFLAYFRERVMHTKTSRIREEARFQATVLAKVGLASWWVSTDRGGTKHRRQNFAFQTCARRCGE